VAEHLSPAAQAVLDAYQRCPVDWDLVQDDRNALAAALRAAADQVAPLSTNRRQNEVRAAIRSLAAELEGQP
jgi:hypothetical protein